MSDRDQTQADSTQRSAGLLVVDRARLVRVIRGLVAKNKVARKLMAGPGAQRLGLAYERAIARAESAERDRDAARTERKVAEESSHMGTWVWSDTGPNDIDTMSETMTVTMTAQQLRSMLAKPERELAELRDTVASYLRESERSGGSKSRSVLWSALTPR